ncbi:hypothetical protein BH23CHL1_BH23CHL1_23480 [soil metagenome]
MSLNTRGFPGEDATPVRVKAVIQRDGQYLLAQHDNRRPENIGKWTFLGGWIDPADASPEDTVGVSSGRSCKSPGACLAELAASPGTPETLALAWCSLLTSKASPSRMKNCST